MKLKKENKGKYLKRFGVSIPDGLLTKFDKYIGEKGYTNRSEALRDLIRKLLVESEWEYGNEDTIGVILLVYDHHKTDLTENLTSIQHGYLNQIYGSFHIHLDHSNCMEILIAKGKPKLIKQIADKLGSTKGVKY